MKLRLPLLSIMLLVYTSVVAQKSLSIELATFGLSGDFAPDTYKATRWRGNTHDFTYLKDYTTLMIVEEKTGWKERELSNLATIKSLVKKQFTNRTSISLNDDEMTYFPTSYEWIDDTTIWLEASGKAEMYGIKYYPYSGRMEGILGYGLKKENAHVAPNYKMVAYTDGNNLAYTEDLYGTQTNVTNDPNKGIVNGSGYVHRQEFGIESGIFWSPSSQYLAYYRKDETMVAEYPLVNTSTRIASLNNIRYPMAGETSEEVTIPIYDLKNRKTVTIKTGTPADQYLTCVTWDPNEKYIYVGILNREQNHLKLNKYETATGNFVATLFEEKHPKYVEPLHSLTFLTTKPDHFIFQSERDGHNHLYLYTTAGTLVKQITKGEWDVTDICGFDTKEENIYYLCTNPTPLERHLQVANIKTGKMQALTTVSGTHSGQLSADGMYWLDFNTSTTLQNEISMVQTKKGTRTTLLTSQDKYKGYNIPKMEMVTLTAADGKTPLYGRLIYPAGYAETSKNTKFPVIVYVYGGPHAQLVNNRWLGGASLFEYYMAQQGFVMFTVDNRGSDGRGMEFENVIHRNLGVNEMADQMKGVEYLTSLSFVDPDRIGVYGWSFGGFMSISLMLNHPDVFKVGVAGGPVCDWKYYEVMYGERYMDTPQENPDGYKNTSVINKAEKLKGRLLVIHGAQDDVVVMQHSLEFVNACIKKNKPVDYFVYPDHKHNVRGKDRVHLNTKIADYFNTHLK